MIFKLPPVFPNSLNKARSQKDEKAPAFMKLKVGEMAPDFTLLAFDGKDLKKVSLQDLEERKTSH
jgi:peroxiredoxin